MTKYEIILYWSDEDGAFIAEVPELPGCMADGPDQGYGIRPVAVAARLRRFAVIIYHLRRKPGNPGRAHPYGHFDVGRLEQTFLQLAVVRESPGEPAKGLSVPVGLHLLPQADPIQV